MSVDRQDGEQIAPRAELNAALAALIYTSRDLIIWPDSAYVVDGVKKAWGKFSKTNQDLWSEAREILLTR